MSAAWLRCGTVAEKHRCCTTVAWQPLKQRRPQWVSQGPDLVGVVSDTNVMMQNRSQAHTGAGAVCLAVAGALKITGQRGREAKQVESQTALLWQEGPF